jgi:hypothetical protein
LTDLGGLEFPESNYHVWLAAQPPCQPPRISHAIEFHPTCRIHFFILSENR